MGEVLIPVVNRLHDAAAALARARERQGGGGAGAEAGALRLDLPQVAVVGGQSSGKSSVLEALVGRDFLPRGPEICTRRPLVLQLVQAPRGEPEFGEFLHLPGQRIFDFSRVREEIQKETDRGCGAGQAVSSAAIRLRISSPHVLTMTLVDLPGITKVPVGDQPSDIEARIREMIHEYIQHESCIILAVHPANQDLANSDALTTARAVDPDGLRTVGVLTKLDIMDRGTDAAAALRGEVVPLRLGYVGCVNRCQADIKENVPIQAARDAETAFFRKHPAYGKVAEQCGTRALAERLNGILVQHIRGQLPHLRTSLQRGLSERLMKLQALGEGARSGDRHAQGGLVLRLLKDYCGSLTGELDGSGAGIEHREVAGGARIRHIFKDIFSEALRDGKGADSLTDEEVRTAIVNCAGVKGSLLMPELPFEVLVSRLIEELRTPCLQCPQLVREELVRIASRCEPDEINRFPNLRQGLQGAVSAFVEEAAVPAEDMIHSLIQCELAHINTSHPSFIGGARAIQQVIGTQDAEKAAAAKAEAAAAGDSKVEEKQAPVGLQSVAADDSGFQPLSAMLTPGPRGRAGSGGSVTESGGWLGFLGKRAASGGGVAGGSSDAQAAAASLPSPPPVLRVSQPKSDQEKMEVDVTRLLVSSYFGIVQGNLEDMVPKVVMNFMVRKIRGCLQEHLVHQLYKEDLFDKLTEEHGSVAEERQECHDAISLLRASLETLDSIPADLWEALEDGAGGAGGARRKLAERSGNLPAGRSAGGLGKPKRIDAMQAGGDGARSAGPLAQGLARAGPHRGGPAHAHAR